MGLNFPEHGDIRAEIDGRVLVIEAFGFWNPEMYRKNLARNTLEMDAFRAQGPWGMLLIRRDSMVVHAEVLALMYENLQRTKLQNANLAATAWVASPELEGYAITMPLLLKYHRNFAPCEVFQARTEAEAWLGKMLADAQGGK